MTYQRMRSRMASRLVWRRLCRCVLHDLTRLWKIMKFWYRAEYLALAILRVLPFAALLLMICVVDLRKLSDKMRKHESQTETPPPSAKLGGGSLLA